MVVRRELTAANDNAGAYILYTYMMAQRRKVLRGPDTKKAD